MQCVTSCWSRKLKPDCKSCYCRNGLQQLLLLSGSELARATKRRGSACQKNVESGADTVPAAADERPTCWRTLDCNGLSQWPVRSIRQCRPAKWPFGDSRANWCCCCWGKQCGTAAGGQWSSDPCNSNKSCCQSCCWLAGVASVWCSRPNPRPAGVAAAAVWYCAGMQHQQEVFDAAAVEETSARLAERAWRCSGSPRRLLLRPRELWSTGASPVETAPTFG